MQQRPDQHDHEAMMKNPNVWPRWPWLPLKKAVQGGPSLQNKTLGVFHADDTHPSRKPRIYFTRLFEIRTYFPVKEWEFKEYDSIEDILKDGWIVD